MCHLWFLHCVGRGGAPASRHLQAGPGLLRKQAGVGRGREGPAKAVKAAQDGSPDTESAAMERPHFPLAMGLGLLAFCLLTLSPDARAELRSRRTGERQNLSPTDPRVQKAAQAAVASYNMGSDSLYYFRDTKVIDAKYQVRWLGQRLWDRLWNRVAVERDNLERDRDRGTEDR